MKFEKYHSTGNDFLLATGPIDHLSKVSKYVCDRHFGIGADGILIAYPSSACDIKMVYYNSDGSEAPMCGNGLRAFAHYVYQQKLVDKKEFIVETLAGPMAVHLLEEDLISIHLNAPIFKLDQPHLLKRQANLQPIQIEIEKITYDVYALFLGTLHGVVFVNHYDHNIVMKIGNKLCHHPNFPENININFVKVIDSFHIEVQTFERGAGPTLSCGTGVSASAVVASKLGLTQTDVLVKVPGGNLKVNVSQDDVILTGPTQWVATVHFNEVPNEKI